MENRIAKARPAEWRVYYRGEVADWCRDFELGEPKGCRRKSCFLDENGGVWECYRMRCPYCGEETFAILSAEAGDYECVCDNCKADIEFEPVA